MQVSVETVSNIERRVTVEVPAERIDSEVEKKLQQAAQTVRLDGFRPGKVPMKVVRQRFGADIYHEVADEVMRQSFFDAMTQENLNPAGPPQIEPKKMELGEDLEYVATFEVYPEIELKGLADIEVDKPVAFVEEPDIDEMIETLRKQRTQMKEVERKAQSEDQVILDFKGTLEGETFEGGAAEGADIVLGSNQMVPGFEDGIVGMKAGEEKTISLVFPEKYHVEDLAGKAVEFAVKLNKVSEPVIPELDDEFYKEFGIIEGGNEAFRAEVCKNMERELESASNNRLKSQLFDALAKTQKVTVPSAVIDQEIKRLKQEMMQQYGGARQNFDLDGLPRQMFEGEAAKRASTGLIISQYVKDNKIELDEGRLKARIDEIASTYDDPEQVINYLNGDEQRLAPLRTMTLEEQVVEHLLDTVQVTVLPSSYSAIVNPQPKEAEGGESETEAKVEAAVSEEETNQVDNK